MSYGLVLNTAVSRLRTALSLDERTVSLQPEGQPTPELSSFPTYFIGVCGGYYRPGAENDNGRTLHEEFGFKVVVSTKITFRPKALYAMAYDPDDVLSLYSVVRRVQLALHDSFAYLSALNTDPVVDVSPPYIKTPKWQATSPEPIVKTGEWLHVDPSSERMMLPCCLVAEVEFGGIERIQCLDAGPTVN
jgi:hypothetical protein